MKQIQELHQPKVANICAGIQKKMNGFKKNQIVENYQVLVKLMFLIFQASPRKTSAQSLLAFINYNIFSSCSYINR